MLSNTVVNFLYHLLRSEKSLPAIINDLGHSERFVVAIDFEIMHKVVMTGNNYVAGLADDLSANVNIWTDFVKSLLTSSKSLDVIAGSYSDEQRYYIAKILAQLQGQLLEKVSEFVDAADMRACNSKVNH